MNVLTWTLVIFLARVLDVSLGTFRVQFIIRRKKVLAALTGFIEVLIFILIVSRVIQDVQHWPYVLAYAGGFATGTLLGMHISELLSKQIVQATVISNGRSLEVEEAVRKAGFALTRLTGTGRDGPVEVLDVVCASRRVPRLTQAVGQADPQAFFFTQELTGLRGGYVLGLKSKM